MPFVKGQSGNPAGRKKDENALRELAREHSPAALNTLSTICTDTKQPGAARVAAANALLDRGWGKPAQAIEHSGGIGVAVEQMSEAERLAFVAGVLNKAKGADNAA